MQRAIVVYQNGGPPAAPPSTPPTPPIDVDVSFVTDDDLREVLERNVHELQIAMAANAWTAAIVLAGSIAEGALAFILGRREAEARTAAAVIEARPPGRRILHKPLEEWSLWAYIEVASEMRVLTGTANAMAHPVIRNFRNMVHPRVQLRDRLVPDRHAAEGSVVYLRAILANVVAAL